MSDTFKYMAYVGSHSNLIFAIDDPAMVADTTKIICFGGRGAITTWCSSELYAQLELSQYDKLKDKNATSDFIQMIVPVEFTFVDSPHGLKATGIIGDPTIKF